MGKLNSSSGVYYSNTKSTGSKNIPKSDISIDNKKIVTRIDTTTIEKKYDTLGEVQKSNDKIGSSIDKLKKIKGE